MRLHLVVLAVVLTVSGCGGPEVTGDYGVFYAVGPDEYDDDQALRDLAPCLAIDGADEGAGGDSLPPQRSVDFAGSSENRRRLERCLAALPGTRITGLTEAATPVPS